MLVFETVNELQKFLKKSVYSNIGFVPTMGALHLGHLSLVEEAQKQNELTVCSIFVNPAQFNKQEDLINYPRNVTKDINLLETAIVNTPWKQVILFLPSEKEIYPEYTPKKYHFNILSKVMEAKHRPGHFDGVAMVIERFLTIINPTNTYLGEKDFQQLAVVRALNQQLKFKNNIIGCPIVREPNGLAMSSRNLRLSLSEKEISASIYQCLNYAKQNAKKVTVNVLKNYVVDYLKATKKIKLEYFELADGNTLVPIKNWNETNYCVAFIAVHIRTVRLIDNMTLYTHL